MSAGDAVTRSEGSTSPAGRPALNAADASAVLHQVTRMLGDVYGSSQICHFLYALAKMHRPETVVELGAGLGVSTFWLALGMAEVGRGELWAVDDLHGFAHFRQEALPTVRPRLDELGIALPPDPTAFDFFGAVSRRLGIDGTVHLLESRIDAGDSTHFGRYPFSDRTIDLLFSDFDSSPAALLQQLTQLLPRMSDCSSLFLDTVPTLPASQYMIDKLFDMLNAGRVPRTMGARLTRDQRDLLLDRRYTVVHLTYNPQGHQCGTSWIKIEPHDLFPYPRVPFARPRSRA